MTVLADFRALESFTILGCNRRTGRRSACAWRYRLDGTWLMFARWQAT
jgi:hypothetical protein